MPVSAGVVGFAKVVAVVALFKVASHKRGMAGSQQVDKAFLLTCDMIPADIAITIFKQDIANGYLFLHSASTPFK